MLETPLVRYDSIKIGTIDVALSSDGRVSFNAPYNRVDVRFTPTNCSLSNYEVRITEATADWDIGVGNLAYWNTNIAANVQHSFYFPINSTLFNAGDGTYRVGLYAKSSVDGSWDVSYIFCTINGADIEQFTLSDGSTFDVLTTRDAPNYN